MLKQRLLTAAVLIPLVVWAILSLSTSSFAVILGIFALLGAREWNQLAGYQSLVSKIGFPIISSVMLALFWYLTPWNNQVLAIILSSAAVWWIVGVAMVIQYPAINFIHNPLFKTAAGLWVLIPMWVALVALQHHDGNGPYYVLFLLILIWVADSCAYFVGRQWGKNKLAPKVSPGKTIEGLLGALAGGLLWGYAGMVWFEPESGWMFLVLCFVTVLFSVLGDLVESLFKREAGVKDSGHLLPGHGGMLDRIDSLTSAAPIFVLGLMLLEGGI